MKNNFPQFCIGLKSTDSPMQKVSDDEKTYIYPTAYLCTATVGRDQSPLYRSGAGSNFCGTEMEIWAGFGTVGSTEKKLADYVFEGSFFMFS